MTANDARDVRARPKPRTGVTVPAMTRPRRKAPDERPGTRGIEERDHAREWFPPALRRPEGRDDDMLKTRQPTGRMSPPVILVEGGEKTGKAYRLAELSASDRIGRTFWIPFGHAVADEYGAVAGADFEIVEHDGSYAALYDAVSEIRNIAYQAKDAGDAPVLLGIDQVGAEWDLLKGWADNRARGSRQARRILAGDPNADIDIGNLYWTDANEAHARLMRLLMTFPGIVVMTARGRELHPTTENGQPVEGKRDYRVEAHKGIGFDASCWVRLSRDEPALVVGYRSVTRKVRPGVDPPVRLADDWTLEWLIFDFLGFDLAECAVPDLVVPRPARTPQQIADAALRPGTSFAQVKELYAEARDFGVTSEVVQNEFSRDEVLHPLLKRIGDERREAEDADRRPTKEQRDDMAALWAAAGDFEDERARLDFMALALGRSLTDTGALSRDDADKVIARLQAYIQQNTPPAGPAEPGPAQRAAEPAHV